MIKHRNGMIRPKQQNKSEECAKMQQFRRRWQPPMRLICRMRECAGHLGVRFSAFVFYYCYYNIV